MWYYLSLQGKRFYRAIGETGIHPIAGLILLLVVFIGGSLYLFDQYDLAPWIYAALAVSLPFNLYPPEKIKWLKSVYQSPYSLYLRLLESTLVILPFVMVLIWKGYSYFALAIVALTCFMVLLPGIKGMQKVIFTPFKKTPFENIRGFRSTFWLVLLSWFVCYQGIRVQNFNLAMATGMVGFLLAMSYYFNPEKKSLVWMFSYTPQAFLFHKISSAFRAAFVLNLVVLVALLFFYPERAFIILGLQALGYVYLATLILGRYAGYPKEMGIPQALLLGFSVWFPPMLIIIIPVFYKQAQKRLQLILV